MKIVLNRLSFLNILRTANLAVNSNHLRPLLKNIKLSIKNSTLILGATNYDNSIECIMSDVVVDEDIEILVPGKELLEIVNTSSEDFIEMEFNIQQEVLKICTPGTNFEIICMSADKFPNLAKYKEKISFTAPAQTIHSMLQKTSFTISDNPHRYAYHGLLVTRSKEKLAFVSTDSKRLAYATSDIDAPEYLEKEQVLVSKTGVEIFEKALRNTTGEVKFSIGECYITLETSIQKITTQLVYGKFPNYNAILPKGNETVIKIIKNNLDKALRKTKIITGNDFPTVVFNISKNLLTITAKSDEKGSMSSEIEAEYDGEDYKIWLSSKYITDFTRIIKEKDKLLILLLPKDSKKPLAFEDDKYLYVLSPLTGEE